MESVRRFDNFEWLLSHRVVKENRLPDENELMYDAHGGFHVGMEEIYFVEGFYSMYVREFGPSFVQRRLEALEEGVAKRWADYALKRIPDVIRYENSEFEERLEELLSKLKLPASHIRDAFRPYMPFLVYEDYCRFAMDKRDSPLYRYFYVLLILWCEADFPEDATIRYPFTYATCPYRDKCSAKERCRPCKRCHHLESRYGKNYDFAKELNEFQKEMTNHFLSAVPQGEKEEMLVRLYESFQQVNQSGIFAAKLSLSYDKVLYGGKKPLTGSFYLRWDKVKFFNGYYIVRHPDMPCNSARPYKMKDAHSRKAFNDISGVFMKRLPPLHVEAKEGRIVRVMNRANLTSCISILEHKVSRADVSRKSPASHKKSEAKEMTKMEAKSLCKELKSRYLDYLCSKHLDCYKVVYCVESRVDSSGVVVSEYSFIFTIGETSGKIVLAYENASESRCTYIFPIKRHSWRASIERIYDFFASNEINKRQLMASGAIDLRLPGDYEFHRLLHSDYLTWVDHVKLHSR